jgi:mRNA interferase MazF
MEKDFDNWNSLQKRLDNRRVTYCRAKEIWWCHLGVNVGCEENGKNINFERPVLILKKFNQEMLWILPMTSINKQNKYYSRVFYRGREYSIILSQIRTISSRRLLRKVWVMKKKDFKKVRRSISCLLST